MGNFHLPQLASARRGRARVFTSVVAVLMLSSMVAIANAAPPAGVVEGVARDAQQHPLAGVTVQLKAADGSTVGSVTSGADGSYRFTGIAAGTYSVAAQKQGAGNATATVTVDAANGAQADLTFAAQAPVEEITVTAQRLNEARNNIEPNIGASTYNLSSQTIDSMPGGGDNTPFNQVLLQAPGVDQDSLADGTLHVRNEHLNVQYRINGVALPDGVSFFGQGLSPRFIDSMSLVTGALPAQYGLRTAGIVDIQTKSGVFQNGGSVGMYGGSYGTLQSSTEYAGSAPGGYNYFVAGDYMQSDHGINAVTPNYDAVHDQTQQGHAFGYLEKIIDPSSKASLIAGSFTGTFQIPNVAGVTPVFGPPSASNPTPNGTINGVTNFDSNATNEHQEEGSYFAVASYLRSEEDLDYQISAFTKYSTLHFFPDIGNDIAFNGIAQNALRQDWANGLQAEGTYRLRADHTLRGGVILNEERTSSDTMNYVLPVDGSGNPTSSTPLAIADDSEKTGWTYSAYLQDEWKILPTVTLNYGGRFDVVNTDTMENQLSPRLNAVWQATPDTTVHGGYARYFTPPPFELFTGSALTKLAGTSADCAQSGPGTSETGTCQNSPVKAERDQYFDGGVTQVVLPGLKVGVDAYYKYARNLIDEGQFGAPVILTTFNYHAAFNRGVELTTSYDKGPFSYYGNLAIAQQKAEDISSAQYNFSPGDLTVISNTLINTDHSQRMTASGGVSYLWDGTRYSVDMLAGTGLRSQEPNNIVPNGSTVPSYEQVNFGISHRFENAPGGPIEIRADVINVFDETYLIRSGTGIGVFASQYGPRRSFFMGVKKEF
jgi:outer membrane receptor protein involved in Fe transport